LDFLGCESLEELKNMALTDFCSKEDYVKLLSNVKSQGKVTDLELEISLPNGDKKWAILTTAISNCGNRLEGSFTDVTIRKRLEKELNHYREQQLDSLRDLRSQILERCVENG
jgi:hypothetical protein